MLRWVGLYAIVGSYSRPWDCDEWIAIQLDLGNPLDEDSYLKEMAKVPRGRVNRHHDFFHGQPEDLPATHWIAIVAPSV